MVGREARAKAEGKGSGEEDKKNDRRARPRDPRRQKEEEEGERKGGRPRRRQERDEVLSGSTLLNMLKSNPPKVTKYTKGELLSIARLPASSIRPKDLDPMIDKENKNSQLVHAGKPSGPEAEGRKERRDRRRQESMAADVDVVQASASPSCAPGSVARAVETPVARQSEELSTSDPAVSSLAQASKTSDGGEASRAEKWFGAKVADPPAPERHLAPGAQPPTAQAPGAGRGLAATSPVARAQTQAQSAHAQAQAQAMQAAAYMQALQMNAAAGRGYPGLLPLGYPPYLFPYGHPYAGYPAPLDCGVSPQLGQGGAGSPGIPGQRALDPPPSVAALNVMQARLAAANAGGVPGFGALGGFGQLDQAAAASSPSVHTAKLSPKRSPVQTHLEPALDPPLSEITQDDGPPGAQNGDSGQLEDEEAGCSQS